MLATAAGRGLWGQSSSYWALRTAPLQGVRTVDFILALLPACGFLRDRAEFDVAHLAFKLSSSGPCLVRRRMKKSSLASILFVVFIDLIGFGMIIPILPLYWKRFGSSEC